MALKGFYGTEMSFRRNGEYKIGPTSSAGTFYRLGSTDAYLALASVSEVQFVSEWDVTATGIEDVDILKGVHVLKTKVNLPARVIQLQPGDLVRTDQLASGSDTGAVAGTDTPGTSLSFFNGKARKTQTGDTKLAEISAIPNANTFDADAFIWVHIVRLA